MGLQVEHFHFHMCQETIQSNVLKKLVVRVNKDCHIINAKASPASMEGSEQAQLKVKPFLFATTSKYVRGAILGDTRGPSSPENLHSKASQLAIHPQDRQSNSKGIYS